jgi:hypothetical protein
MFSVHFKKKLAFYLLIVIFTITNPLKGACKKNYMHTITKTILALALPVFAFAQNGPIDFEPGGEGGNWTWTVFENDVNPALEIVSNPDPTGLNTSATVAKFTALQAGQPWAGCETLHGAGTGSFDINANNAQIRIMVWKSEISDVGIKLVRPDSWSLGEIKVANTKINEWEQLTFDFSSHIGLTPDYDQLVVFPDFQARGSDQVIYFDNVFGEAATISLNETVTSTAKIYPNPGQGEFHIESPTMIKSLKVFNTTGQLVISQDVNGLQADVDAAALSSGVYFIQVEKDNSIEKIRWVKS